MYFCLICFCVHLCVCFGSFSRGIRSSFLCGSLFLSLSFVIMWTEVSKSYSSTCETNDAISRLPSLFAPSLSHFFCSLKSNIAWQRLSTSKKTSFHLSQCVLCLLFSSFTNLFFLNFLFPLFFAFSEPCQNRSHSLKSHQLWIFTLLFFSLSFV